MEGGKHLIAQLGPCKRMEVGLLIFGLSEVCFGPASDTHGSKGESESDVDSGRRFGMYY